MAQKLSRRLAMAAMVATFGSFAVNANAGDATNSTVMTVGEMCGGCVKKITKKLQPMAGIAGVECDVSKKTVKVVPDNGVTLSPRKLWETIGKTPTKLVGPSGTYSSKPKQ